MGVLEVKNVSKSFDEKKILDNVSIKLNRGEIVSLIGSSGSGKTTLFNIIAGIMKPDEGNVILEGEDITGISGKVSYMLQKDMLLPYRTVLDNVALPLIVRGIGKKEARQEAVALFEQFGIAGYENKYPAMLSGGMRQRAALLRTYLFSSHVAILDEPFSALDMITKREIHAWYLDIMKNINLSTIFVTHDIDEAILLSDRIYVLSGVSGQIIKEIIIDEEKPRQVDFNLTDKFLRYKNDIIKLLM
ncbi:MAG: ABC transporter ATP-binding protein [Lachnospiraceae bacterium]|nr:ABC transporter ATP-binding protein [Lachnospiraceae bacterium]